MLLLSNVGHLLFYVSVEQECYLVQHLHAHFMVEVETINVKFALFFVITTKLHNFAYSSRAARLDASQHTYTNLSLAQKCTSWLFLFYFIFEGRSTFVCEGMALNVEENILFGLLLLSNAGHHRVK